MSRIRIIIENDKGVEVNAQSYQISPENITNIDQLESLIGGFYKETFPELVSEVLKISQDTFLKKVVTK